MSVTSLGGPLAIVSEQTALLYICGSLPFFLGGELGGDQRHAFYKTSHGLLGQTSTSLS